MSVDQPGPPENTEPAHPVEPLPYSSPWAAPHTPAPYTAAPYTPAAYTAAPYIASPYASAPPIPPVFARPALPPAPGPVVSDRRGGLRVVLLAAVVAALVGGGAGAGVVLLTGDAGGTTVVQGSALTGSGQNTTPAALDGSVASAAAKIRPSVVTIHVASGSEQGTGSGVILTADGYILTNNHVVTVAGSSGTMTVERGDGTATAATLVGTDPSSDLAVIKIKATDLTPATFASSAKLIVGQTVVAVGAPLGLSDTVTSGIVSNVARPVRSGTNNDAVFNAVQTDAAINPGNSGGPLVDLNGEVVGIDAAIATESTGGVQVPGQTSSAGSIGIGFAIPSTEATRVADELIKNGKATHAVLGVSAGTSASDSTTQATPGARLQKVDTGGAAANAGLQAGDIVTKVADQRVNDVDALIATVRDHAPGEHVELTYVRDGKTTTVSVTLGSA